MGLLPDMHKCRLRMHRECRERFPRYRLHRKPLVSDPGMHHSTCVTHVPWCMSGSLIRGSGENVPGIPGACATRNFAYLVRGPSFPTPKTTYVQKCNYGCDILQYCFEREKTFSHVCSFFIFFHISSFGQPDYFAAWYAIHIPQTMFLSLYQTFLWIQYLW